MHQSNGKSTRSAQVPHSQIPPKQQKLWRNMRGRTRRDGLVENVDLDLLSLFPQKGARIMGGIERRKAQRVQQWGEELAQNRWGQRKKKTPFYRSPRIQPLATHQPRYYRTERGTTAVRYYRTGSGTTEAQCLAPLP